MEEIFQYESQRESRNTEKRKPEYREKKKKQRRKAYIKNKAQPQGDYSLDKSDFTFE